MTIATLTGELLVVHLVKIENNLPISIQMVSAHGFGYAIPHVVASVASVEANSPNLAIGELLGAAIFAIAVGGGWLAIRGEFQVLRHGFVHLAIFMLGTASFGLVIVLGGRLYAWQCFLLLSVYGFLVPSILIWKWYSARRRIIRERERVTASRSHYLLPIVEDYDDPEGIYHENEDGDDDDDDFDVARAGEITDDMGPISLPRYSDDPSSADSGPSQFPTRNGLLMPSAALEYRGIVTEWDVTRHSPVSPDIEALLSLREANDIRLDPSALQKIVHGREQLQSKAFFGPLSDLFQSLTPRRQRKLSSRMLSAHGSIEGASEPSQTNPEESTEETPLLLQQAYLPQNSDSPRQSVANMLRTILPDFRKWNWKSYWRKFMTEIFTWRVSAAVLMASVVEFVEGDDDWEMDVTQNELDIPLLDGSDQRTEEDPNQTLALVILFASICLAVLIIWFTAVSQVHHVFLHASLVTASLAFICAGLVLSTTATARCSVWRVLFSCVGIALSIVWLFVLASELVDVLKALGLIFGISDAVLGLVIFSIGNSTSTFSMGANISSLQNPTLAHMSNFSAALQSILLGLGLSGSWAVWKGSRDSSVRFNPLSYVLLDKIFWIPCSMLLSLTIGLLLVMPYKGWKMDRSLGVCLILLWTIGISITTIFAW